MKKFVFDNKEIREAEISVSVGKERVMYTGFETDTISCDRCGYYDSEEMFLVDSPEGFEKLKRFGWDVSNLEDKSYFQVNFAGAICPECGNFSELDFDPDERRRKEEILSTCVGERSGYSNDEISE